MHHAVIWLISWILSFLTHSIVKLAYTYVVSMHHLQLNVIQQKCGSFMQCCVICKNV